jgi:hypothetical protein
MPTQQFIQPDYSKQEPIAVPPTYPPGVNYYNNAPVDTIQIETQQPPPTYYGNTGVMYQPVVTTVTGPLTVETTPDDEAYNQTLVMFILGFFINCAWIAAFCMSRHKGPRARNMGNIACALFVITILVVVITIVAIIIIVVLSFVIPVAIVAADASKY